MLNKEKHYMTSVTKVTNTILSTRFAMHLLIRNIEASDWELGAYPHSGYNETIPLVAVLGGQPCCYGTQMKTLQNNSEN
jgi:hypothetical protein